jgi:hypothetical protein
LKKPCTEEICSPQISTSPWQPQLSPILQDTSSREEVVVEAVEEEVVEEEAVEEEAIQTQISQ